MSMKRLLPSIVAVIGLALIASEAEAGILARLRARRGGEATVHRERTVHSTFTGLFRGSRCGTGGCQ